MVSPLENYSSLKKVESIKEGYSNSRSGCERKSNNTLLIEMLDLKSSLSKNTIGSMAIFSENFSLFGLVTLMKGTT